MNLRTPKGFAFWIIWELTVFGISAGVSFIMLPEFPYLAKFLGLSLIFHCYIAIKELQEYRTAGDVPELTKEDLGE